MVAVVSQASPFTTFTTILLSISEASKQISSPTTLGVPPEAGVPLPAHNLYPQADTHLPTHPCTDLPRPACLLEGLL